jgi:parvulin-like peptidyl-prolyl isomerase
MMGREEYKVRIISVADDRTARTVLEKLRAGVSFDELVRMYSVASSKESGARCRGSRSGCLWSKARARACR